jgi:sulfite exporter TauE/SafE
MAVPNYGQTHAQALRGKLLYNTGRIATYGALGLLFGVVGQILSLTSLQRWLSIATGVALGAALLFSGLAALNSPSWRLVIWLKKAFGSLLRRRTRTSVFVLGALNGILPCGLVYVAAATALATGGIVTGGLYMIAFGLGTLPMMLGLGLAPWAFSWVPTRYARRLVPACVALIALLLVLRGLGLGIPFLSPSMDVAAHSCH